MKYGFMIVFLIIGLIFCLSAVSAADAGDEILNMSDASDVEIADMDNLDGKADAFIDENQNESEIASDDPQFDIDICVSDVHIDLNTQKSTCRANITWNCDSELINGFRMIFKDDKANVLAGCIGKHGSVIKEFDCNAFITVLKEYSDADGYHSQSEQISFKKYLDDMPLSYDVSVSSDDRHRIYERWDVLKPEGAAFNPIYPYYATERSLGPKLDHDFNFSYVCDGVNYLFTKHISFTKRLVNFVLANKTVNGNHVHLEYKITDGLDDDFNIDGKFRYCLVESYKLLEEADFVNPTYDSTIFTRDASYSGNIVAFDFDIPGFDASKIEQYFTFKLELIGDSSYNCKCNEVIEHYY